MLRNLTLFLLFSAILYSSFIDSQRLSAQSLWLDRNNDKCISLEILKPNFDGKDNTTFITSITFLSGRYAATKNIIVIAEIPFSHTGIESSYRNAKSENAIGNPYLGIEILGDDSPVFGEVGLRLPLAPKEDVQNALLTGFLTEYIDRSEAFILEILPISAAINYIYKNQKGFSLRYRGGLVGWIPTGDRDESEWIMLYGAQAGYRMQQANFVAGFSGRLILSASTRGLDERSFHQLVLAANAVLGDIQPGLSFRIPIDEDMRDILDLEFGLTLVLNLN